MGNVFETYHSPRKVSESMPCELSWSYPTTKENLWVFCSKKNDELQNLLSDSSMTKTFEYTRPAVTERIKYWLERAIITRENYLVQFWAPVIIGGRRYATTSDQPFALTKLVKGLCSYRMHCLEYFPIDETSTEEDYLGPPGRVFRNGLPEISLDVGHYSVEEYPERDLALSSGVRLYLALPLFELPGYDCFGVLEVVHMSMRGHQPEFWKDVAQTLMESLKMEVGLNSSYRDITNIDSFEGPIKSLDEIHKVLKMVGKTHQLPYAQIWVPCHESSYIDKLQTVLGRNHVLNYKAYDFIDACSVCYIQKGHGVVGKAFSSHGACFCKNISQLSAREYSLVSCARKYGLTGCFAICLRGTDMGDDNLYILEFFFPIIEIGNDPRSLLSMLLTTMIQHLQSNFKVASGLRLGEKLLVEVLKTSWDDEFDSFEIYELTGSNPAELHYGGETLQLDSLYRIDDAINNGEDVNVNSAEQNIVGMERYEVISTDSGNKSSINRLYRDYGITRDVLLQHSGKKQNEVANILGVSRSTLKRMCRKYEIYRWPPRKAKSEGCTMTLPQEFVQPAEEIMEDSWLNELPLLEQLDITQNATTKRNDSSIRVKVTYRDDIIKFELSVSSGKMDLEEEVAKRFHLSIGSFRIKYLDEDDEWISVICDADLKTCISILRSLGRNTVRMVVNLLQVN